MKHASWIPGSAFFFLIVHLWAAPLDVWHWRNPAPQGNTLKGIAHGNGRFVAVGEGGTVLISSNGVDWQTLQSTNGSFAFRDTNSGGRNEAVSGRPALTCI